MTPSERLKDLHVSVWTVLAHNRGPSNGFATESRRLTEEEWDEVKRFLNADGYIYQMSNASMGFGCAMSIGIMTPSTFPGVPNEVEWLACFSNNHLPLSVCDLRDPKERGASLKDRTFFDDGWRAFSPYTHSESNTKNLLDYGKEAPKSKGYYEY